MSPAKAAESMIEASIPSAVFSSPALASVSASSARRRLSQARRLVVAQTELGAVAKRLLIVIAEELLVLGDMAGCDAAEPAREPGVKLRPGFLGERPGGGRAGKPVSE